MPDRGPTTFETQTEGGWIKGNNGIMDDSEPAAIYFKKGTKVTLEVINMAIQINAHGKKLYIPISPEIFNIFERNTPSTRQVLIGSERVTNYDIPEEISGFISLMMEAQTK
ncbi:hypothetical protein BH10PAT1_BH10PAT1_6800 [soil metagenome]